MATPDLTVTLDRDDAIALAAAGAVVLSRAFGGEFEPAIRRARNAILVAAGISEDDAEALEP